MERVLSRPLHIGILDDSLCAEKVKLGEGADYTLIRVFDGLREIAENRLI